VTSQAKEAMAQAHRVEGLGVAYEANADATGAQIDGSSSAEKGFDTSYIWEQITYKLQIDCHNIRISLIVLLATEHPADSTASVGVGGIF